MRRVATELIAAWIGAAHPRSRVEVDVTVAGLAVLALVTGPSGRRLAVMFVDRRLGAEAWWHADDKLRREGLVCSWIFAPRQFLRFPQPSLDAPPDDPAVRDRERGDIVLDRAVFREMRGAGQWPLLFNIATRELANLLVPGGVLAGRLALPPPASPERVLHLLPAALDECRLSRDGIATPAVNAEVLAAPRLARERRQALVRPPPRPFSEPPALAVTAAAREPIVSRPAVSAPAVSVAARRSMRARLVAALNADGQVTTLASVIARLGSFEEADEQLVRELLDDLRAEGVVDFVSPLGRFSAIHRRSAASPGGR